MNKLSLLLFLVIMFVISGCNKVENKKDLKPPNIILILSDDLGYNELGCYGQEKIKTPNIDKLAEEGMTFTQHYSGSSVCAPSRCAILTGLHTGHATIRKNTVLEDPNGDEFDTQVPLNENEQNIAKTLKRAGYITGAFGKWGLGAIGTSGDPIKQGFDRFYGYTSQRQAQFYYPKYLTCNHNKVFLEGNLDGITGKTYAPESIANEVLNFVSQNKDNPFFLYYASIIPHLSLQVPEEDLADYVGKWDETPCKASKLYQANDTPRATYAAMISHLDKEVGRLMARLKELNLDDNTIVIFTSDNGTTFETSFVDSDFFKSVGEFRGLKSSLHEGGIRVPFIARWLGKIPSNSKSDLISVQYDLPLTFAELANTNFNNKTDGISLLPTLLNEGKEKKNHEFLFWEVKGYDGAQIAVRMGDWKGIKKGFSENPNPPLELYDLQNDLSEKTDVSSQYPEIVKKIGALMISERTEPEYKPFRFGEYSKTK